MIVEQLGKIAVKAALETPLGERVAQEALAAATALRAELPLAARLFPEVASTESGRPMQFLTKADIQRVGPITNPLAAPLSRIKDLHFPAGQFQPNETEWRQMMISGPLRMSYAKLVAKGLAPELGEAAPRGVRALLAIKDSAVGTRSLGLNPLTGRGFPTYKSELEILPEELTGGAKLLDYGAGGAQEFAKAARLEKLPVVVHSFDPGLEAPLANDISRASDILGERISINAGWYLTPEEYRFLGRLRPEPFTVAKVEQLPQGHFDTLLANWSAIYYDRYVADAMDRMTGLLRPGGRARVYPVVGDKWEAARSWMRANNLEAPQFRSQLVTWKRPS